MEISIIKDASVLLNAMGIGNSFLLSFVYFQGKFGRTEGNTKLLSILFFAIGMIILNTIFNFTGYSSFFYGFESISNALSFAVAPLLYLYIKSCLEDIDTAIQIKHLAFFYLFLFFTVCVLLFPYGEFGSMGAKLLSGNTMLLIWNINFFGYLWATFYLLRSLQEKDGSQPRIIFWSIASIWTLNLLLHLYRIFLDELPQVFYLNITLLFTVLTLWISFQKLAFSKLSQCMKPPKDKGNKVLCTEEDKYAMLSLIENNKYYRDPELNIRKLSKQLDLPYTQLSILINHGYHQNFNEFINGLRIREVVNSLLSGEHRAYTIMGLAQRAGFKSRSAFYAAFKKEKGTTPKEFLQTITVDRSVLFCKSEQTG